MEAPFVVDEDDAAETYTIGVNYVIVAADAVGDDGDAVPVFGIAGTVDDQYDVMVISTIRCKRHLHQLEFVPQNLLRCIGAVAAQVVAFYCQFVLWDDFDNEDHSTKNCTKKNKYSHKLVRKCSSPIVKCSLKVW